MNKFLKIIIVIIGSIIALGIVVAAQAGTGKNYVPYLGIGIFIIIILVFRKKNTDS